jgi:hypothetical protein
MSEQFEQLSKDLAKGMSRRKAIWRFVVGVGGVIGGSLLGTRQAEAQGNSVCVRLCREQGLTGRAFGECVSHSAQCPAGQCAIIASGGGFICAPVG